MEQLVSKMFIGKAGQPGQISFDGKPLELHLDEVNHSPDGFMWGYGGSGPAQTAYCILRKFLMELSDGDEEHAVKTTKKYYQRFKEDVISKIPMKTNFGISMQGILDWFEITIEGELLGGQKEIRDDGSCCTCSGEDESCCC